MDAKTYAKTVLARNSGQFHQTEVPFVLLTDTLSMIAHHCNMLDQIKKVLVYGRAIPFAFDPSKDQSWPIDQSPEQPIPQWMKNMLHGMIGAITEAGELAEAMLKVITVEDFDPHNILEEVGDTMWYLALIADSLGSDLGKEMDRNDAKLEKRYPRGFELEREMNRDLASERITLEQAFDEHEKRAEAEARREDELTRSAAPRPTAESASENYIETEGVNPDAESSGVLVAPIDVDEELHDVPGLPDDPEDSAPMTYADYAREDQAQEERDFDEHYKDS